MNKKISRIISIDEDLFFQLKIYAVRHKKFVSTIIEDLVAKFLEVKGQDDGGQKIGDINKN